jgi:hypothetical protein
MDEKSGVFILSKTTHPIGLITSDMVCTYQPYLNDVRLCRCIDEGELLLLLIDALGISNQWPDYVLHQGRLYKRGPQDAIPEQQPMHSVFGFRHYESMLTEPVLKESGLTSMIVLS